MSAELPSFERAGVMDSRWNRSWSSGTIMLTSILFLLTPSSFQGPMTPSSYRLCYSATIGKESVHPFSFICTSRMVNLAEKMAKPRKPSTAAFSMTSHNDNQIATPDSTNVVPGGAPTKIEGPTDVLKEKTHTWLLEKTKGRTAQFDLIFKRSSNRMEYQRRILDLRSKVFVHCLFLVRLLLSG
jgi:hypothetical protein